MSFEQDIQCLTTTLMQYYHESVNGNAPVVNQQTIGHIHNDLNLAQWAEKGGIGGNHLASFIAAYCTQSTRLQHPHYMAHKVAVPHLTGAQAALLDVYTKQPISIYEIKPGAETIKYIIMNIHQKKNEMTPKQKK